MFSNKLKASGLVAMLVLSTAPAHAQTISEISELQKVKVIADLKKQIATATEATTQHSASPTTQMVSASRKPDADLFPSPSVLAVYGVGDDLAAAISESGAKAVRVKAGDRTSEGWLVERVTRSGVSFTRLQSRGGNKQAKEVRVHVAWTPPVSNQAGSVTPMPVLTVQPGQVPAFPPLPSTRQAGQ